MMKLSPIKEFAQDHVLGGGQVGIWIKQVLALELPPSSALQRRPCRGRGFPSAQRAMKALWQEDQSEHRCEGGTSSAPWGAV